MKWNLPEEVEFDGEKWNINADYRDILGTISKLNDMDEDEQVRVYVSLALFYPDFESIPPTLYQEALKTMVWFIGCGEDSEGQKQPKTIDWEQDYSMIVSDINKVAGCDVRGLHFCHWWTFVSWFNSIGEGQLSTVVSIREKRRKQKKLSEWEREFYRANKKKIDFKTTYTTAEEKLLKEWGG